MPEEKLFQVWAKNPSEWQLQNFANRVGALPYHEWGKIGISERSLSQQFFPQLGFGQGINKTIQSGGRIHFDLTNLDVVKALSPNGGRIQTGIRGKSSRGLTAFELREVLNNPRWRRSTTFYRNGKPLSRSYTRALVKAAQNPTRSTLGRLGHLLR